MPKSLADTLDDADFRKLNPNVQRSVLRKMGVSDPTIGKLMMKIKPASENEPEGFLHAFASDVGGTVKGLAQGAVGSLPGVGLIPQAVREPLGIRTPGESFTQSIREAPEDYQRRKAAGYGVPYRLIAPVGEQVGVNARGMEDAAAKGDTGGVLGHAAAPIATMGAVEGLRVADVGTKVRESNIGTKLGKPPLPEHLQNLTDEQRAKYGADLRAADQKYIEDQKEYAEKESQARSKWVEKAYNAKKSVADRIKAQNKKMILETGAREHVRLAKDNITATHQAVRGSLDERWNGLRDEMTGKDAKGQQVRPPVTVSGPEDIYNGIRASETEYLRGAPQSLQQFRNLIRELGIDEFVEKEDGTLEAAKESTQKPLDWETARVHYSAIGDKLAGGGLPGNVYQALKKVHTLLDDKLQAAADSQGHGQQYRSLKADWSEYMKDWKDVGAVSTGGSPLAKIMQAPDQAFVAMQVTGKAGDRLLSTYAKYKRFGANPELMSRAREMTRAAKDVEIPRTKAGPEKYEKAAAPERKQVPVPKPKPKPLGPGTKAAIHLGVRGAGLLGGIAFEHPWYGYAAGELASHGVVRVIENRRARAIRGGVPESMVPPE